MPTQILGGMLIPTHFRYQSDTGVSSDIAALVGLGSWSIAWIVQAPRAGTLCGFLFPSAGNFRSAWPVKASFQSVDTTTGRPSGVEQYQDFTGQPQNRECF